MGRLTRSHMALQVLGALERTSTVRTGPRIRAVTGSPPSLDWSRVRSRKLLLRLLLVKRLRLRLRVRLWMRARAVVGQHPFRLRLARLFGLLACWS